LNSIIFEEPEEVAMAHSSNNSFVMPENIKIAGFSH
jgi:hypothetical protein